MISDGLEMEDRRGKKWLAVTKRKVMVVDGRWGGTRPAGGNGRD